MSRDWTEQYFDTKDKPDAFELLKKAISDGIVDAYVRILIYSACGMLVIAVCQYLYGFMKGLLG